MIKKKNSFGSLIKKSTTVGSHIFWIIQRLVMREVIVKVTIVLLQSLQTSAIKRGGP